MEKKLFVGNLSYQTHEDDLKDFFAACGTVQSVDIIKDRFSGQSKGFGFVEMSSSEEAEKALSLNGNDLMGRNVTVSEARLQKPREKRWEGGGGGRDRGGRW